MYRFSADSQHRQRGQAVDFRYRHIRLDVSHQERRADRWRCVRLLGVLPQRQPGAAADLATDDFRARG